MADESQSALDDVDVAIVRALQGNGRLSTADLARTVSMSASSTADRVRRLTDVGVLRGYRAVVDPAALGYLRGTRLVVQSLCGLGLVGRGPL